MVKGKDKERKHWHWVILVLVILALGFSGYSYKVNTDKISSLENDNSTWECIDTLKVTWRQCESMSKLVNEGVDIESKLKKICDSNTWQYDCKDYNGEDTGYGWIYIYWGTNTTDDKNCMDTKVYTGDCIKWNKVKYA